MPKQQGFLEVYELEDEDGRPGYTRKAGVSELLPLSGPMPNVGDILLLPTNITGGYGRSGVHHGGVCGTL